MSHYTAVRLKERGTSVDVTKILPVCNKMGHVASLNILLFWKRNKEKKVCLEWKLNTGELKKWNITS
jgi:hypothetical protein